MVVLFVCISLEPGKDGIGDYTRILASELISRNHTVYVVSINDRYVNNLCEGFQIENSIKVPVIRIPSALKHYKKFEIAKKYIDYYNPDWLSLQYVPFGFHTKGLPLRFTFDLGLLIKNRLLHIMFHELWVGINKESSFKFKIWGLIQREIIRLMLILHKPNLINTHTGVYRTKLRSLGFQSSILPLFTNIKTDKVTVLNNTLSPKLFRMIMFGSIHPKAPLNSFLFELVFFSQMRGISVLIQFVGRTGAELSNWISSCNKFGINYEVIGERSPSDLSSIFAIADLGLTTTPLLLVEKSGSVAAMWEHNLPVISISAKWTVSGYSLINVPKGVEQYTPGLLNDCIEKCLNNKPSINNIDTISEKLEAYFIKKN